MPTLLCCLFGFEEPAVRTLRGLARLFRPSLTADWEFTDAWHDDCILLICNIDDPTTRDLWQQGSLGDMPLALATGAPDLPNGWVLRKPLRGQGMNGLVHVLNQAAAHAAGGHAPPAAQPAAPAEPEGRATIVPFRSPTGGLASSPMVQARAPWSEGALATSGPVPVFAKSMPQSEPEGAPMPALVPDPPPAGHAEGVHAPAAGDPTARDASGAKDAEADADVDIAEALERATRPALTEGDAPTALPPPAPLAALPPPSSEADRPFAAEAQDPVGPEPDMLPEQGPMDFPQTRAPDEGISVNVVAVSDLPSQYGSRAVTQRAETPRQDDDAALRDRLRGLHTEREPDEIQQDDFLALLNRMHWLRSPGLVTFEGMAPICIVPVEGLYYGRVTLEELAEHLVTNTTPVETRVVTNVTDALGVIGGVGVAPGQLRDLFWLANLRCANDEQVTRFGTGAYRLRRWPDLTQLPHERHHVTWCGILARRPVTLVSLASLTSATERELSAFLAACAALSILEQVEVTAEAEQSAPVAQTAKSRERTSIFRSLLNRLGFGRS